MSAGYAARGGEKPSPREGGVSYMKNQGKNCPVELPRSTGGARLREVDGERVAKHVRRAQHAVPLRMQRRIGVDGGDWLDRGSGEGPAFDERLGGWRALG